MSLSRTITIEAHRLGFTLAGFTTPEPPPHWQFFINWLSQGRHASMHYLADSRRADPRLVLPDCQSILVLAVRYPNPGSFQEARPGLKIGRIAAYAWGHDYHLFLPERMTALVSFIEKQVGHPVPHRCYTDTGPLLERDLAQRAGLGWIGKNTCLINPRIGSYFLLAEILLGIEIEPSPPFSNDHCGNCTRCISACPTGCLLPDRTLDAQHCLSYLTIENREEIPVDARALIGNQVFGCDICQQVCPWNRFSQPDHDPAFNLQSRFPVLVEELALDHRQFIQKYKENAIRRSKRGGYLRNVAVALGNTGDPLALPALKKAVLDEEPLIQEHAKWAIEHIRNKN